MKTAKKEKKKDEPVIVKGSFIDLVKASVKGNPKPRRKVSKKKKEQKN